MDGAIERLRRGEILAVKGLGGFHLFVDARNTAAVATLRDRKTRPDKPLALMYPSVAMIAADCRLTEPEIELLTSAIAPIVLVEKRRDRGGRSLSIASNVAPNVPDLGVMLPHSPLHHLLMQGLGFPVVATSANRSGEPLCIDGSQVWEVLSDVVDAVVDHDRPIARPLDDSITRVIRVDRTHQTQPTQPTQPTQRVQVLRHGRGYAPSTLTISKASQSSRPNATPPILAVGAHLKNAIALSDGQHLILSQYIGDLDTPATIERLHTTIEDLLRLYRIHPQAIACDAHPDYVSTQLSHQLSHSLIDPSSKPSPPISVQHHYAHTLACMAEHGITAPTLAIAWDGTGYGLDGTVWGGEWLRIDRQDWQRVAHWRSFPLPGGDLAAREPRRSALGWLWSVFGEDVWNLAEFARLPTIAAFTTAEKPLLKVALQRSLNTPQTSSVGRMFDAVASLLGLHQRCSFEGQGAIAVEALARSVSVVEPYAVTILDDGQIHPDRPMIVDSSDLLREIVRDCRDGVDRAIIAARFQQTLIQAIALVAQKLDLSSVVLTGGCFQNRLLTEQVIARLDGEACRNSAEEPIRVHIHQRIPPNDGGLAIGQILAAWRSIAAKATNLDD
jgi:hydrogenase maturation protein HypF